MRQILADLMKDAWVATWFKLPVDVSKFPDYLSIVKHPMSFSVIMEAWAFTPLFCGDCLVIPVFSRAVLFGSEI